MQVVLELAGPAAPSMVILASLDARAILVQHCPPRGKFDGHHAH